MNTHWTSNLQSLDQEDSSEAFTAFMVSSIGYPTRNDASSHRRHGVRHPRLGCRYSRHRAVDTSLGLQQPF